MKTEISKKKRTDILLGAKIGGFTLLVFLGIGISAYGFYRSGDVLYALLNSGKGWSKVLGWSALGYLRAALRTGIIVCSLSTNACG
jgi:hypothetical protein